MRLQHIIFFYFNSAYSHINSVMMHSSILAMVSSTMGHANIRSPLNPNVDFGASLFTCLASPPTTDQIVIVNMVSKIFGVIEVFTGNQSLPRVIHDAFMEFSIVILLFSTF